MSEPIELEHMRKMLHAMCRDFSGFQWQFTETQHQAYETAKALGFDDVVTTIEGRIDATARDLEERLKAREAGRHR